MIVDLLILVIGIVLLIKGADWMVDGASTLAKKFRVSNIAIGLTIVAFGTSAPELVVNTYSSYQGHQDLVFGNVIGSNIINLFAILGIAGLITPIAVQSNTVWKEIPISLLGILILYFLANDFFSFNGHIVSRIDGFILLGLFISFLVYVYSQLKQEPSVAETEEKELPHLKTVLLIVLGLAGLAGGGHLVVMGAVSIATDFGLSEKLIGLTIIAFGTSLPELATSVVAAIKKNNDIAVGNIIGSNIFNIFFIVAASALVRPIPYDTGFNTDLYLLGGGTLFLFIAMFTGKVHKLDRGEAAILLTGYIVYTVYTVLHEVA